MDKKIIALDYIIIFVLGLAAGIGLSNIESNSSAQHKAVATSMAQELSTIVMQKPATIEEYPQTGDAQLVIKTDYPILPSSSLCSPSQSRPISTLDTG